MSTLTTPAPRWILLGDSIQSEVMPTGPATALTASQIPALAGVVCQNISSPGMRVGQGSQPGTGAYMNRAAIGLVSGLFGAAGLIVTLGTNDYGTTDVTASEFSSDYQALLQYAKTLVGANIVCISPIWRNDQYGEGHPPTRADGTYTLQNYRTTIQANACAAGVHYIDGLQSPLTNHPELYADGLHPNVNGHAQFAPWLVTQMQALGFWMQA